MDRFSKNQSIFIKGVLSVDADHIDDDEAISTRLVITTQDNLLGTIIKQFHNVTAIKQAALDTKDLIKGDSVYIVGKLLWLESEYLTQSIEQERTAVVVAMQVEKIPAISIDDSYQMMVASGPVVTQPEYTASMTGAITRSLILTKDIIIQDAIDQSHNILAIDKLAIQLKEFVGGDEVEVIAKLLWLNSEDYTGDSIIDDRAIEVIAERVAGKKNCVMAVEMRSEQVDQNILNLSKRIKQANINNHNGAAYIQSILNKLNGGEK